MRNKTRKLISTLLTLAMLVSLITVVPITASAATGAVTIDISTLGGSNDDNIAEVETESQWAYDDTTKILSLRTANGDYTLTGVNANLMVQVTGTNANITLGDAGTGVNITSDLTAFRANTNCTVRLDGTSTLTSSGTTTGDCAFLLSYGTVTVNGGGALNATSTGNDAIQLYTNCELVVEGTGTTVNAETTSGGGHGVYLNGANTVSVGDGAEVKATGAYAIYSSSSGNNVLNTDGTGIITATAAAATTFGAIYVSSDNITLSGSGTVNAIGGINSPAINASANILMSDEVTLKMTNNTSSDEVNTFQKLSSADTHLWKLTLDATTTDPLTYASIEVTVETGKTGTVERELKPGYTSVTFTAAQTGGTSGTADSTGIVITFDTSVTGLTAADITITNGTGAAIKGALSEASNTGTNTVWTIALSRVSTEGNVTVSVASFDTFYVATVPQTVAVYKAPPPAIAVAATGLTGLKVGQAVSASITYTLTYGEYATPIIPADFAVSGLPEGLTAAAADRTDGTTVTVLITGTPTAYNGSSVTITRPSSIPMANVPRASADITPTGTVTASAVAKGNLAAGDLAFTIPAGDIYNGFEQGIGSVTCAKSDGAVAVLYDGSATVPTDAGTYIVTANVAEGTNYEAATGFTVGSYTIAPKPLTLRADNKIINVGELAPTYTYTVSGLVAPDTAAVIDTDPTMTVAGFNSATPTSFPIVISLGGTSNPNYTIGTYTNGLLTVTDKTIVTISGVTVAGKTYDGTAVAPSGTATVTGSSGDHLALVYTYTDLSDMSTISAPTNAGSYALVISTDPTDPLYIGESAIISFTISKATITITADNKTATRGGAEPAYTYTVTGLATGETLGGALSVTCPTADMATAGTYPIVASGAAVPDLDNYNAAIAYVDGTLTVSAPATTGGGGGGGGAAGLSGSFTGGISAYNKGSAVGLTYTVNKDFAQFDNVRVDNNLLTRNTQYTAESGSTKITLLPSYLDTLAAGTHTLRVGFKDNTSATAQFTVTSNEVTPITPTMPVNPFKDVFGTDWFIDDVIYAYDKGLIDGTTPTTFSPNSNLTYAQAVTLAARMHQLYTKGEVTLANSDGIWYQSYVDYAIENGIIGGDDAYDWDTMATRAGYAAIFANALPDEAFAQINEFDDGAVPDVDMDHPQAAAIYKLYRAGILQGNDTSYTFSPDNNIRRSEVAAILTRMMNPDARIVFGN